MPIEAQQQGMQERTSTPHHKPEGASGQSIRQAVPVPVPETVTGSSELVLQSQQGAQEAQPPAHQAAAPETATQGGLPVEAANSPAMVHLVRFHCFLRKSS